MSDRIPSSDPLASASASPGASIDTPLVDPPAEIVAEWDARLQRLWGASLDAAMQAAGEIYAPDPGEPEILPDEVASVCVHFWRMLIKTYPAMPTAASDRYLAVVAGVWNWLRIVREMPTTPFIEDYLEIALRAVRRLQAGSLTAQICAILYDYHRGIWTPHLTKPQLWKIRVALARTIAALPPDALAIFWKSLQSPDPMLRHAMLLGLDFLQSAHAVPHLLRGLELAEDHYTRTTLVNRLEEIADPHAIPTLMRLRRETATTDWTLSRQIARAIRVIEQQNRNLNHRTLLRPSTTPPDTAEVLLRPATDTPQGARRQAEEDEASLVRPVADPWEDPEGKQP